MVLQELKANWFPIVLCAVWMVLSAAVLTDFAGFARAMGSGAEVAQKAPPIPKATGKLPVLPAAAWR
jgi:hypothetical protein